MRKKYTALLMFPDKRARLNGFVSLLTFLFNIARILAIIASVVLVAAIILFPIVRIVLIVITLGLILIAGSLSLTPFLNTFLPITIVIVSITVGIYILRYIFEWFIILNQHRRLKRNPEVNKHYLAVSRVVRRIKVADLILFGVVLICAIVGIVFAWKLKGSDAGNEAKIVPIICIAIIVICIAIEKIFSARQFSAINSDIKAIHKIQYPIE